MNEMNWKRSHIHTYYTLRACIELYIVRIEQERDRKPLLRAEIKVVKLLHSATKIFVFTILGISNLQ